MKLETITTNQDFLNRYLRGEFSTVYDYQVSDEAFKDRINESTHSHSEALSRVIAQYMNDLNLTPLQNENIAHIANNEWVVIGGQQAGLFVSPLYTIHKIISIIVLAREQSKKLKQPIVPVFWIAGEDHDYDEVNHAYLMDEAALQLKKVKVATKRTFDSAVSDITLTDSEKNDTIGHFVKQLKETKRTKTIYETLKALPNEWTPMFKHLIHELFKNDGLLLIDSHDPMFRKLEQSAFQWLFNSHEAIDNAFVEGQKKAVALIGQKTIESASNVHLFINNEDGRQLLHYDKGKYSTTKSDVTYSKSEIRTLIEQQPELFSNNVVTRPLMQEMMFNTLAFIAGPSEIKYWAELKEVFELLDRKMPVIVPRMQLTYVKQQHCKMIEELKLTIKDILEGGISNEAIQYLERKENKILMEKFEETIAYTRQSYESLEDLAENDQVSRLISKNMEALEKQFDYLKKHYRKDVKSRNEVNLSKFKMLELTLHPHGGLQERVWHPLQMMNDVSMTLFNEVLNDLEYTFQHVLVHTD